MQRLPRSARMALLLSTGLLLPDAHALGTAAGSNITNTATATFADAGGLARTVSSNTSALRIDEVLDVAVAANDAGSVSVGSPATDRVLSFTVTNTGNGPEAFALSVQGTLAGDDFDPANVRLFLDTDDDGHFDIDSDTPYALPPVLAADASLVVFVVADMPDGRADRDRADVRLLAEAVTAQATPGSDVPGTVFAGAGEGGGDAVVGGSQADAEGEGSYEVVKVAATLTKSQAVLADPVYGSNAVPGATVTYTLVLDVTGTGSLADVQIDDAIPAGTRYVPGSLTLDAAALSDAADGDAGVFAGGAIAVGLGTVTAPATHTVTFRIIID